MPLVRGRDARGRPIYGESDPRADEEIPDVVNETEIRAVAPPVRRQESNINYDSFSDRTDTIRNQGVAATQQAQESARRAMQARLNSINSSNPVGAFNPRPTSGGAPTGKGRSLRSQILQQVASQKGVMYQWGGKSPKTGFDCSGLVQWAYGRIGISMPRVSGQQSKMGVRMPINKLQPGDLVANPGHIAVYAGNGMMWEAPRRGVPVRLVRVRSNMYGIHLTLAGD